MNEFVRILKEVHNLDIRVDSVSKAIYSNDASIYEIEPIAVFIPRSVSELQLGIKIAHQYKIPVIPRGAATGIAGGCIGHGLVIDTSKYLNKIISIDYDNRRLTCEPGLVQDHLNQAVYKHHLRLGPDTSTGNRATIGGMVSCNSCGAHALKYGYMGDHIEELDLILSNGELIHLSELSEKEFYNKCDLDTREGEIYRSLLRVYNEYSNEIEEHFPKTPRRSSGYSLDKLKFPMNLAQLLAGSEGTLGFISQITVKLSPIPHNTGMVLISAKNLIEGLRLCPEFMKSKPYALELIDKKIMMTGSKSPSLQGKLTWLQQIDEALFVIEFEGENRQELEEKCKTFYSEFRRNDAISWSKIILEKKIQEEVWNLRKSGLGLLLSSRSYLRAIAFIEDISIPPQNVAEFCEKLLPYLKSRKKEVGIYGHVGDGGLHIRPFLDLRMPDELDLMKEIMQEVMKYVKKFNGVLSGEHGDGLIRSWTNRKMFGEKIYKAFTIIKKAFDPDNIMNPGKIVDGPEVTENLRLSPSTHHEKFVSFLNFQREGGIELASDLCNGNGQCRKKEGVMCPSYQATLDEKDSTRARANALRAFFHKKISYEEMMGDDFYSVMDLCIQCKGCKTECPSQVDMAKMKSEYLYHYYESRKTPVRNYFFGNISTIYRLLSNFPSITNWLQKRTSFKALLSIFGITSKRDLPNLSKKRFSSFLKTRKMKNFKKKVVLFNDTFTEFLHPEIGLSTIDILEKMSYEVIIPPFNCCGRTLISKGMLPQAKEYAKKLIDILYPYAKNGIQIVGLEPSCILTVRDEFLDFYLDKDRAETVSHKAKTIDQFLEENLEELKPILKTFSHPVYFHTHCHQKADVGSQPTLKILESMPHHPKIREIHSGCCGMAGSFGYESEHYNTSQKIAELKLFPELRKKEEDAIVIANGISCRTQIKDGCSETPLHLVEFLATLLK